MKRRSLLAVVGAGAAFAGCLGDDESDQPAETEQQSEDGRADEESSVGEDESCTDVEHDITVSYPPTVPDEADVLDAMEAGITELEGASAALSEAENSRTDEIDEAEEYVWLADGQDHGELYETLESTESYVEFEETVYFVETYQAVPC
jgi:hypothetical protein